MTERFSRQEFEDALPKHKVTGALLWQAGGMLMGEYVYYISVTTHAQIMIRSSVDSTGYAASTGNDSIRLWLVDPRNDSPVASKLSHHVTRVRGWQTRLTNQLRILYRLAHLVRPCTCGELIRVGKSTKNNEHKGWLFASCGNRTCNHTKFQWIADNHFNFLDTNASSM
jgi:hypothetical protein